MSKISKTGHDPTNKDLLQLHEQEINQRVRLMLDTAPIMIEYCNKDLQIIDCNQTASDFFGYESKEAYCRDASGTLVDFQVDGTPSYESRMKRLAKIMETGYDRFEFLEHKLNGDPAYLDVTGVRAELGGEPVIITYFTDITQLKESELAKAQAQEALMHRERLLYIGNQAAEILLTAGEDEIQDALMAAMKMLGHFLEVDRVQIWTNELIDGEMYYAMRYEWLSDIGQRKSHVHEGVKYPYSAKPHWLEMFLYGEAINAPVSELPSEDANFWRKYDVKSIVMQPLFLNREFIGFFSVDDCQNERKFTSDEMDILASVGIMVASVFNRMEQTRLGREMEKEQQRIEIAEASNREKSKFLARMSHEIRTPISAVLGVSEIELQNPELSPRAGEAFAKIHSSSNILLGIVNDILDLSKIEAGKMELLQEEYETSVMISDVAYLHPAYINNESVKFRLHVDENFPAFLIGDVLRIKQIMNNLLSNAFKYTEVGFVDLSLKCEEQLGEFVHLIITISDTGMGMTEEQLKVLQESEYTRFHEHKNRFIGGTGLGMPIVHNLLQLMNANMIMESTVGVGTDVTVRIPQKVVPDKTGEIIGKETSQRLEQLEEGLLSAAKRFSFTPSPMPYGSVLVVDDVEANHYVAKGLLSFYDLNIDACFCGEDAIEKIKQGNVYDIVFMDEMMPGLSGTETMQQLRKMGYEKPVIALTANAILGHAEECIRNGFDGFISKPIQTKQLNSLLNKFVRDSYPREIVEAAEVAGTSTKAHKIESFQKSDKLVEKLKQDFARLHRDSFTEIIEALDLGDRSTAHRMAHTLKGLGGLMHEQSLAESAEAIENAIAAKKTPTPEQLSSLESEMTRVLESIVMPEPANILVNTSFDKEKAQELLNELHPMLESRNAECLKYTEQLRKIPETAVLVMQIEDFDFELATHTVVALKKVFRS